MQIDKVRQSLQKLERYLDRTELMGYDPYDALNSPFLSKVCLGLKYPRIAFTQGLKLSPVNLRPFLGVRPGFNPKGLGLFLSGNLKRYSENKHESYLIKINKILGILEKTKSPGYSGYCWGYNFDWQSRAAFVPRYTPTIVNTVFIGHAYLDAYLIFGESRFLDIATSSAEFILRDLQITEEDGSICFSYTPTDRGRVHNANILGAGFLSRLYSLTKNLQYLHPAERSARFLINHQRGDGSWYYADSPYQKWIDSHHTGFVLEGLHNYIHFSGDDRFLSNLIRGLDYYKSHFFLRNGHPMFFNDRPYPVDIHGPCQAIVTLSRLNAIESNPTLLEKISSWMIDHLQDERGYFYYRKEKFFINKIPYIRWGQAWSFHALSTYMKLLFDGNSR
jgi:rhamnogalacturonyl hydrolase YesR